MKKLIIVVNMSLFFLQSLVVQGYQLFVVNKAGIPVEILSYVQETNSLNVNQQHVQTDSYGLFWYANKKQKVDFICTDNAKKASGADVRWKYTGAFGIKTAWHILHIEPLDGVFVLYIFKDGLIALHNATKNSWQYKRIPMELVKGIPLLKDAVKEQSFSKSQFMSELAKVAKRVGEKASKDPFALSDKIADAIKNGVCPIIEVKK